MGLKLLAAGKKIPFSYKDVVRILIVVVLQALALNQQLRVTTQKSSSTFMAVALAGAGIAVAHFSRGPLRANKTFASCLTLLAISWYFLVLTSPKKKKLTMEIMFLASLVAVFLISWFSMLLQQCSCRSCSRFSIALALVAVPLITTSLMSAHVENPLTLSALGLPLNLCGMEKLQLDPLAGSAVSWQGLVPRRLFNFFTGDEECGVRKLSWYAADVNKIVAVERCPGANVSPTIVVADPSMNDLGNLELLESDARGDLSSTAAVWERRLMDLYGNGRAAPHFDVALDATGKKIRRVVLRVNDTMKVHRSKYANAPVALGNVVLEIPILSTAMSVICGSVEEYHMHPLDVPSRHPVAQVSKEEPPANVLLLIVDAVSRLEMTRSLPLTQHALKKLQSQLRHTHLAEEAVGLTTVGHSTNFNLGPAITGAVRYGLRDDDGTREGNLLDRLKAQYGDDVAVSFISGICSNVLYFNLGSPNGRTDGFSVSTLDREVFSPMCHVDYSSMSGNFIGPYSMVKRCIGQQHVHEHIIEMLKATVKQDRDANRSFFQIGYFLEGHEGTHGVLKLLDEDFAHYLDDLVSSGFFEDSRNVLLVMSDHGNHMGPYYELSVAGKIERSLPLAVWFLPRDLLSRRDAQRGKPTGTSAEIFSSRMRRASTHFDTYLTLADLMNHPNASVHCDRESISCSSKLSSSLLDPPPNELGSVHACKQFNGEANCAFAHCISRK